MPAIDLDRYVVAIAFALGLAAGSDHDARVERDVLHFGRSREP
jgi:hypothetical protein